MSGTFATTAVLTGGLTGVLPTNKTLCKTGIITSAFSLYVDIPKVPKRHVGGGPYPGTAHNKFAPGEIQNFYQPVPQEYYIVPRDKEADFFRRYKVMTMKVQIGEKVYEKEYSVPEERADMVVSVLNFANTTIERVKATVTNIKTKTTQAVVKVKNFRLFKK